MPAVICSSGYFKKFSYKPTLKDGPKCTNCPMACTAEGCNRVLWKYNMPKHWAAKHVGQAIPAEYALGPKEVQYMEKLADRLA